MKHASIVRLLAVVAVLLAAVACGPLPTQAAKRTCAAKDAYRIDTVWTPDHKMFAVVLNCYNGSH